jgi:hypothetical protein
LHVVDKGIVKLLVAPTKTCLEIFQSDLNIYWNVGAGGYISVPDREWLFLQATEEFLVKDTGL